MKSSFKILLGMLLLSCLGAGFTGCADGGAVVGTGVYYGPGPDPWFYGGPWAYGQTWYHGGGWVHPYRR